MTEQKTIKTTRCMKCGEIFDANYRRCPKCGHSNTLHVLGYVFLGFVLTFLVVCSTYLVIKVNKLEDSINNIQITAQSSGQSESLDITKTEYFEDYLITKNNYEEITKDLNDYIVYGIQEGCSFCEETNVFVDYYIYLGYQGVVPVFFVTPSSNEALFTNLFAVSDETGEKSASTPSAVRFKDGVSDRIYVGADEVFELFDNVVAENSVETEK